MIERSKHRIKVVASTDPRKFEREYNAVADEVDEYGPDITVKIEGGNFYACFTYEVTKQIPETIADEFEAAGVHHTCGECPYLEKGDDKRRKVWPCRYAEYGVVSQDEPACEVMLKKLMQGKILLNFQEADND